MTVQELHIDLDLKLQKINSNATQNIEAEEKDWFINNQVIEFINSRVRDLSDEKRLGFQEDFKRLKDITGLLEKESLDVEIVNEKEGKAILPSFIFKHIRTDFYLFKNCKENNVVKNNKVIKYANFKLPKGTHFKIELNVVINNQLETILFFNTEDYDDYFINPKNYFYLLDLFNNKIREFNKENKDFKFYYEVYGENSKQSSFYFIGLNNNFNFLTIIEDNFNFTVSASAFNKEFYNADNVLKKAGNIINTEIEQFLVGSNFSHSSASRPLGGLFNGILKTFNPNRFIINSVDLYYIKQPTKLNVNLNNNLDFSDDICREIINDTVVTIKNLINENRFEDFKNNFKQIE